ncbi:MAG: hypothetical protein K2J40_06780, partial [Ruminococcus sp.]|nr:hypothetical protein [Ruminococcus sp.]
MKKILIFMSALLMISGAGCAEKIQTSQPEVSSEPAGVEITQLMYKQEHLSFPEDMSERMGLFYSDGVKFIYKSKSDGIKIMSYNEDMSEKGATVLIPKNEVPFDACCCMKNDGTIIMFCICTDYPQDDNEDFYENAVLSPEIRHYSADGELLDSHEADGFKSFKDFNYIDGIYEYGENYVISFNGGYALISADGEILDMPSETKNFVFGTDTDGKTYVFDWQKYSVTDGKKMSIDENNSREYGKYVNRTGTVFNGAGNFKLFVIMNEGIYGIAPNDELVQIM